MPGPKLTPAQVAEIRRLAAEDGRSARSIAQQFGVHHKTISDIVARRSWRDPVVMPPPTPATAAEQAWREKVVAARKERRKPAPLPIDKYNAMWQAYQENQSTVSVARVAGVSETCAQKYIDKGDPSRGLRPLRERLVRATEQVQRQEDYTLQRARHEQLQLARAAQGKLARRITTADPERIPEALMAKMLRELQAVMDRAFGLLDQDGGRDARRAEGRFARWTDAEIEQFLADGTVPAHDVALVGGKRTQSE